MHVTGGLYAPTIRHHEGIFYVVCTNILHEDGSPEDTLQNFIVSTKDIWSNEWSNPVYFDFHGIDPSIFFDDDGKCYIQGSASPGPMTTINLFGIDLETGKKLSDEKKIWDGTGGIYPEGPHMYKRDNWYYIMISEGGTHEDHMITVARSKDIWGPYEPFDKNPILTARNTDEYIRYTGHADMFQDQHGQWWGVCLGVRKSNGRYVLGRESFLTAGEWASGEWPKMSQVKMNPVLPNGTTLVRSETQPRLTAMPMVDYLYIRDARLEDYKFSNHGTTIVLTASKGDFNQWRDPVSFIGKRQRSLIGKSSMVMQNPLANSTSLKAGLAYYKDEFRYMKLYYNFSTSELVWEVVSTAKNISKTTRHQVELQGVVALRLEYTEASYQCSYRVGSDSGAWVSFEAVDTLDMTAPDFVGPVIGCFAQVEAGTGEVQFDNLDVE
jgi:beta-xylosidase